MALIVPREGNLTVPSLGLWIGNRADNGIECLKLDFFGYKFSVIVF